MCGVADHDLHRGVDEMIATRGREAVDDRDLRARAGHDERVREARPALPLRPVQHHDRAVDDHTVGDVDERTTGQERVVKHGERIGRGIGARPEPRSDRVGFTGREPAHHHALRLERGIELVVHHPAVAHDHETGAIAGFGGQRPASRGRLHPRITELVGGKGPVAVGIEGIDARIAPDLLGRRGPDDPGELLGRGDPAIHEPLGPAEGSRRVGSERRHCSIIRRSSTCRRERRTRWHQPTAPSMLSSMRRDSSTAYSIGNVFVMGSMNPFTIIAVACCWSSPRLIR